MKQFVFGLLCLLAAVALVAPASAEPPALDEMYVVADPHPLD